MLLLGPIRHTLVVTPLFILAPLVFAVGWGLAPQAAQAQIPDSFTNLQFFPEDISRDDLVGNMRRFSFALGVRCQFCHSGGDGVSFDGVDFASDDKPQKLRARHMLEMAETINSTLLAALPERALPNVAVECQTCHRDIPRPEMIDDIMRQRIAADGVDAAVAHYNELRVEGLEGWSYDFGEWPMNDLASEYGEESPETAAALLRMNAEHHPMSVSVWVGLGSAEAAAGNRDLAIAAYQKALELAPDNPRVLQLLERVRSDPPGLHR